LPHQDKLGALIAEAVWCRAAGSVRFPVEAAADAALQRVDHAGQHDVAVASRSGCGS